jgi:DNA-binding NtrC family response regulator
VTRITGGVLEELKLLPWPGNVRELFNVLRRAVVLGAEGGVLRRLFCVGDDGPSGSSTGGNRIGVWSFAADFRSWMREREREYLSELVRRYDSVAQQAAASGLPQRTLYRKIRFLGVDRGGRAGPS